MQSHIGDCRAAARPRRLVRLSAAGGPGRAPRVGTAYRSTIATVRDLRLVRHRPGQGNLPVLPLLPSAALLALPAASRNGHAAITGGVDDALLAVRAAVGRTSGAGLRGGRTPAIQQGDANPVLAAVVRRAHDKPARRVDALAVDAGRRQGALHATARILGALASHTGLGRRALRIHAADRHARALDAPQPRIAADAITRVDAHAVPAIPTFTAGCLRAWVRLAEVPSAHLARRTADMATGVAHALSQVTALAAGAVHPRARVHTPACLTVAAVARTASNQATGIDRTHGRHATQPERALPMGAGLGTRTLRTRQGARALGPVVDPAVAVVVLAVAALHRRRSARPTGVAYAFVDGTVAVVIGAIADLGRGNLGTLADAPCATDAELTAACALAEPIATRAGVPVGQAVAVVVE